MHSFAFIAICHKELYGQNCFSHNDHNFQDGFKKEFQDQSPFVTEFAKCHFLHNSK